MILVIFILNKEGSERAVETMCLRVIDWKWFLFNDYSSELIYRNVLKKLFFAMTLCNGNIRHSREVRVSQRGTSSSFVVTSIRKALAWWWFVVIRGRLNEQQRAITKTIKTTKSRFYRFVMEINN
jgi:hypothetical protein